MVDIYRVLFTRNQTVATFERTTAPCIALFPPLYILEGALLWNPYSYAPTGSRLYKLFMEFHPLRSSHTNIYSPGTSQIFIGIFATQSGCGFEIELSFLSSSHRIRSRADDFFLLNLLTRCNGHVCTTYVYGIIENVNKYIPPH